MKPIIFKQQNAQRVYNNYIKRCRKAIVLLSHSDQEDVLMEINSHIYEHLQQHSSEDELNLLLNILERMGEPEESLKEVVALRKIDQAVKTFNPKHLVMALLLNIRNGLVYSILSIMLLLFLTSMLLVILKIFFPADTGYFVRDDEHHFGFIMGDKGAETMGLWFIPLMLCLAVLFYGIIIFSLRMIRRK
jgi:hypothetical protein